MGDEQIKVCHDYIREVVMETRKYSILLGDLRPDGTKYVSPSCPFTRVLKLLTSIWCIAWNT